MQHNTPRLRFPNRCALLALGILLCVCLASCSNGITFKAKGQTEVGVSVGGHR